MSSVAVEADRALTDRKKMAILGAAYDGQSFVRTQQQVLDAMFHEAAACDDEHPGAAEADQPGGVCET